MKIENSKNLFYAIEDWSDLDILLQWNLNHLRRAMVALLAISSMSLKALY